jgi:hypothetical protein
MRLASDAGQVRLRADQVSQTKLAVTPLTCAGLFLAHIGVPNHSTTQFVTIQEEQQPVPTSRTRMGRFGPIEKIWLCQFA